MNKSFLLLVLAVLVLGCVSQPNETTTSTSTTSLNQIESTTTTTPATPQTTLPKAETAPADETGATEEAVQAVVSGNNRFAINVYRQLSVQDGNLFYSPWSISSALAMTAEGARGATAQEMFTTLNIPSDDASRRGAYGRIINQINKGSEDYALETANALWVQKDYPFLPGYLDLVAKYYLGKATNLDFVAESENSRQTINTWVEAKTREKIKNLIPQGALDSMTRLVLTNAVYFNGSWDTEFNQTLTKEADFHATKDTTIKAEMMTYGSEKRLPYTETDDLQILKLPYKGDRLSMLVLLPKDGDLKKTEQTIKAEDISNWSSHMYTPKVLVSIPKFKMETEFQLGDTLAKLGMPSAFSPDAADFSGMDGKKDLYISAVIHKAYVDVNEKGTEAAAATAVIMEATAVMQPQPPKIFNADHPFLFAIMDDNTGQILFMGRVQNPQTA
jgi:serpin B